MTTFLHQKFKDNLIDTLNLINGSSMLLAISGGQDSLCMLKLFLDISKEYTLKLGIIHVDHQWRNDGTQNTSHMIKLLNISKIDIYFFQINPLHYSEVEARAIRYQLFIQTAISHNYKEIVTAHSSTDQAETCFQNIIRGSSIDGLNSLRWYRQLNQQIRLVRPILNFTRSEIGWFCRYCSLPVWTDPTNTIYIYQRNRIRHELIPYIQSFFRGNLEQQISNFLEKTDLDCEYLRQNTVKIYQDIRHPSLAAINFLKLRHQHMALQIRVLMLFYLYHTNQSPPYNILSHILLYIKKKQSVKIVYNGIVAKSYAQWLYIRL
jgi:tRNA(Ile)-lysidine synthase